jgi:hypothetical protein
LLSALSAGEIRATLSSTRLLLAQHPMLICHQHPHDPSPKWGRIQVRGPWLHWEWEAAEESNDDHASRNDAAVTSGERAQLSHITAVQYGYTTEGDEVDPMEEFRFTVVVRCASAPLATRILHFQCDSAEHRREYVPGLRLMAVLAMQEEADAHAQARDVAPVPQPTQTPEVAAPLAATAPVTHGVTVPSITSSMRDLLVKRRERMAAEDSQHSQRPAVTDAHDHLYN